MELKFLEDVTESQVGVLHITHATVVVSMDSRVLYVKKRGKSTLELPSEEVTQSEEPGSAVRRLLSGELNTVADSVRFVSAYSISDGAEIKYGVLYYAEISSMRTLNAPELCGSYFLDSPPENKEKWSNPEIDIPLLEKAAGNK